MANEKPMTDEADYAGSYENPVQSEKNKAAKKEKLLKCNVTIYETAGTGSDKRGAVGDGIERHEVFQKKLLDTHGQSSKQATNPVIMLLRAKHIDITTQMQNVVGGTTHGLQYPDKLNEKLTAKKVIDDNIDYLERSSCPKNKCCSNEGCVETPITPTTSWPNGKCENEICPESIEKVGNSAKDYATSLELDKSLT